jgi:preprotein translocase subunit SecG
MLMTVFIWLLTAVLVLDCVLLILLVLVQLPKKEAGAGLAFGGGATDALFGAGSGTALTKITKYAASTFFVVALALTVLTGYQRKPGMSAVQEQLKEQSSKTLPSSTPAIPSARAAAPSAPVAPATPAPAPAPANP